LSDTGVTASSENFPLNRQGSWTPKARKAASVGGVLVSFGGEIEMCIARGATTLKMELADPRAIKRYASALERTMAKDILIFADGTGQADR